MKNWNFKKFGLEIVWYNLNNEYTISKLKKYWKKVFRFYIWKCGIEWVDMYVTTFLLIDLYSYWVWVQFRDEAVWNFKIWLEKRDTSFL